MRGQDNMELGYDIPRQESEVVIGTPWAVMQVVGQVWRS